MIPILFSLKLASAPDRTAKAFSYSANCLISEPMPSKADQHSLMKEIRISLDGSPTKKPHQKKMFEMLGYEPVTSSQ